MADNYLEKKMDDYRHGKITAGRISSSLRLKPGQVVVSRPEMSVFIVAETLTPIVEATVRLLCRYGFKVNLCSTARHVQFRDLAWSAGCTFNPAIPERALADAAQQRGKIDAVVIFGQVLDFHPEGYKVIAVDADIEMAYASICAVDDPDTVASAIIFLTDAACRGVALTIAGNPKPI